MGTAYLLPTSDVPECLDLRRCCKPWRLPWATPRRWLRPPRWRRVRLRKLQVYVLAYAPERPTENNPPGDEFAHLFGSLGDETVSLAYSEPKPGASFTRHRLCLRFLRSQQRKAPVNLRYVFRDRPSKSAGFPAQSGVKASGSGKARGEAHPRSVPSGFEVVFQGNKAAASTAPPPDALRPTIVAPIQAPIVSEVSPAPTREKSLEVEFEQIFSGASTTSPSLCRRLPRRLPSHRVKPLHRPGRQAPVSSPRCLGE